MKIKFTASTHLTLPEHLSSVDMSYGFSYYDADKKEETEINQHNSFSVKVLAALDKFFGHLPGEKNFVTAVAGAINHANENLDEFSLSNMSVQINNDTLVNRGFRHFMTLFNRKNPLFNKDSLNLEAGFVRLNIRHIKMGSRVYQNEALSYQDDLHKKIGKEHLAEFVFFHELGHSLEYSNPGQHYSSEFVPLLSRINALSVAGNVKEFNQTLKDHTSPNPIPFGPIDAHFMNNLNTLKSEIYADATSILMNRNYDIERGDWSEDRTDFYLESIIESRKQSMIDLAPKSKSFAAINHHVNRINHFTSPGLEGLAEKIHAFGNQIISQQDIHRLAQEAVTQGVCRMLVLSAQTSPDNLKQLNTLAYLQFSDSTGKLKITSRPYEDEFDYMMMNVNDWAGWAWVKNLHAKKEMLDQMNLSPAEKMLAVFNLGTNPEKFKKDFPSIDNHNQADTATPIPDVNVIPDMSASHTINASVASLIKDTPAPNKNISKNYVLQAISSIRDKVLGLNSSDKFKI
jgi:hypothetical protein